jgi:hypothetical protein
MPFQGLDEAWEKRHEPLATDAIGRVPDQEERVLDLWSIALLPPRTNRILFGISVVEQPHRVAAGVSRCGGYLIE